MVKLSKKLASAGNAAKNFFCAVALVMLAIVINITAFTFGMIFFNPIMCWILAMLAPARSARVLYAMRRNEPSDPDIVGEWFWQINKILKPILPWRVKKEFYRVSRFEGISFKEEIRFFNEESDPYYLITEGWLSKKALERLWFSGANYENRKNILISKGLSDQQFSSLLAWKQWHLVQLYCERRSLSEKMLEAFLESLKSNPGYPVELFLAYARKNLLPAKIINLIYAKEDLKDLREDIEDALTSYSESQLLSEKAFDKNTWRTYCKTVDKIHQDNQKLLNLVQYRIYRSCGHQLCKEAIVFFISQWANRPCDDSRWEMVTEVIKNELIDTEIKIDENIRALIVANPVLFKFVLDNSKEKEEA